jgi:arylsulfatase A-like enzyme
LPEFGRDRDLNSRRGLDHGDGSDELNYVGGLAWGPDFARGRVVQDAVQTVDVTPTICGLFGTRAQRSKGKRLARLS